MFSVGPKAVHTPNRIVESRVYIVWYLFFFYRCVALFRVNEKSWNIFVRDAFITTMCVIKINSPWYAKDSASDMLLLCAMNIYEICTNVQWSIVFQSFIRP